MPGDFKRKVAGEVLSNKGQYLLLVFCLIAGVAAGVFTVAGAGAEGKQALTAYALRILGAVQTQRVEFLSTLVHAWLACTALFCLIAFFSLMMIGLAAIAALVVYKGFCIGFAAGVMVLGFGSGGASALVFGIMLPGIVLVPCVLKAFVLGWNQSLEVVRQRHVPKTTRDRLLTSVPFFKKLLAVYGAAQIGVLLQSGLSPLLLSLF